MKLQGKATDGATDLRQIRTRETLLQAFQDLLQEQEFDRISIGDLTTRAGVARPTFYLHYKDKSELLLAPLRDLFADLNELPTRPNVPPDAASGAERAVIEAAMREQIRGMILRTLEHVSQRPELFRLILSGRAGAIAQRAIHEQMRLVLERVLQSLTLPAATGQSPQQLLNESRFDMICGFLSGAVGGLFARWLEQERPCPPEELAELLIALCESDFRDVLLERS